jgi:hypothetical protein
MAPTRTALTRTLNRAWRGELRSAQPRFWLALIAALVVGVAELKPVACLDGF